MLLGEYLMRLKFLSARVLMACVLLTCVIQTSNAQIEITDSHGKYRFAKPPSRVVVLNWALAEQMLELGETPVGMADIEGYQKHTNQHTVPGSVVDVGMRLSPALVKIKELKPEIIVIGYSQRSLLRPLSNIATVIYFKNFGKRYNNQDKSRDRFLELAKLFNKTELAEAKLRDREEQLEALKEQLQQAYLDQSLPAVQFIVPDASNAAKNGASLVFGVNSMPFYAAQALGLTVVAPQEGDQFGMSQLTSSKLNALVADNEATVCQFYLSTYSQGQTIDSLSPAKECVHTLEYQNAFGGIMSILYLAESISDVLVSRTVAPSVNAIP